MKLTRKILASVLALVMVLLMLPAAMAAEENVYVLDVSTDLEAMAPDAANAGKEIAVKDYFTVIVGEKTKIDSSKKTFEDGFEATQRLNFQHKTKIDDAGVILPAVKFTTSAAATIKLWWVEGGEDNRQFAILNEAGEEVTRTNETLDKNALCISELKLEAAGTYFLGTPDGSNYLFKMEVTEAAAETPVDPPVEPAGFAAYLQFCDTTYAAWTSYGFDGFALNMNSQYIPTDAVGSVNGAGTYTINYTIPEGVTAVSTTLFYVEIVDAYDALKDMIVSDVKIAIDGTEIAVNQDVTYIADPLNPGDPADQNIYVYHSSVEGCLNNYVIEIANFYAGITVANGTPIDVNFTAAESISITFTLSEPVIEEPAESKTLTIGDKTFTAEGGKWLYNGEVDASTAANYSMLIFDKNHTGSVAINGYGAAFVLNQYGNIVKFYDGANVAFYTQPGAKGTAHFTAANYATVAFEELQEGEILLIFPNDGGANGNAARGWALGLRGLDGKDYFNQVADLEGFTFETKPTEPETQPTEPSVPETEATQPEATEPTTKPVNPGTGDNSPVMLAAVMMMAAACLIVLVQKKRAV